ncbi:SH3 and PX domain-containing protein 2B-like [Ovis canadensis]|uniref:SH3 and PX domain-containing protein 2B-like n=1 Tax=Ovis canadensis TaxID=37174 RepID=UPI0037516C62
MYDKLLLGDDFSLGGRRRQLSRRDGAESASPGRPQPRQKDREGGRSLGRSVSSESSELAQGPESEARTCPRALTETRSNGPHPDPPPSPSPPRQRPLRVLGAPAGNYLSRRRSGGRQRRQQRQTLLTGASAPGAGNREEARRRRGGGAGRRARAAAPEAPAPPSGSRSRRAPGSLTGRARREKLSPARPPLRRLTRPLAQPLLSAPRPSPPCTSSSSSALSQRSPPDVTGGRIEAATATTAAKLAQLASRYRWSGVGDPAAQSTTTPTRVLRGRPPRSPTFCRAPLLAGMVPRLRCWVRRCGAL